MIKNFTDIPNYHICVIYFNDNNGYTYFEDGQKVLSKENRAVIFSGDLKIYKRHIMY